MATQYVLTKSGLKLVGDNPTPVLEAAAPLRPVNQSHDKSKGAQVKPSPSLDLSALAREVHELGARHLDKKRDAKAFANTQLERLGIKTPKQQRRNAKIGVPCLQKARILEMAAEQEMRDSGMKSMQYSFKHKRKERRDKKRSDSVSAGVVKKGKKMRHKHASSHSSQKHKNKNGKRQPR